jgi:hypothetical protein
MLGFERCGGIMGVGWRNLRNEVGDDRPKPNLSTFVWIFLAFAFLASSCGSKLDPPVTPTTNYVSTFSPSQPGATALLPQTCLRPFHEFAYTLFDLGTTPQITRRRLSAWQIEHFPTQQHEGYYVDSFEVELPHSISRHKKSGCEEPPAIDLEKIAKVFCYLRPARIQKFHPAWEHRIIVQLLVTSRLYGV